MYGWQFPVIFEAKAPPKGNCFALLVKNIRGWFKSHNLSHGGVSLVFGPNYY
jgi:hypothetical protein